MSVLAAVAPVQERSTVCLPCTLRPCALSVIEPGVGVGVGVTVGVGVGVGVDVGVGVGVGVGGGPDCAQYLLPVFNRFPSISTPPQTIISLPVHTAECAYRPAGALVPLVAVQVSAPGSYLPPVLKGLTSSIPPQTIISLPVPTAV